MKPNITLRTLSLLGLALPWWYMLADLRTCCYGSSDWSGLLTFSICFYILWLPVVFLVLRARSLRHVIFGALPLSPLRPMFLAALGITLFCVGGAEAFARAQEFVLIRQYGEHPKQVFIVPRWPPFGNSAIGYTSTIGWWGCD